MIEMEKMKKQAKRDVLRLDLLPEPMIHIIQSFLTGKEAAQSSFLSKSWFEAWLTRPTPSFDVRDFKNGDGFAEFATRSMQRYRDMNLRIESFSFHGDESCSRLAMNLTADAIQIGATDLNIEVPRSTVLPAEVLESETLTRLRLRGGTVQKKVAGNVRCWGLKSLILDNVHYLKREEDDVSMMKEIIFCCSNSIEELSLAVYGGRNELNQMHLFELPKLRRLHLWLVRLDGSFFSELASRFPLLKDLSLDNCYYSKKNTQIASTSLECISFVKLKKALEVKLDVPNIRKFVYGGSGLPSLSFKACSRYQLECDISVKWSPLYYTSSWFESLKNLLTKLRRASSSSKISLSISPYHDNMRNNNPMILDWEKEIKLQVDPEPVVVENLRLHTPSAHAEHASLFLLGLFRVCRPTFILHDHLFEMCNTLKKKMDFLNFSVKFDLNMEIYDTILREWKPCSESDILNLSVEFDHRNMKFYNTILREWRPYSEFEYSYKPKLRLHCASV